MKKMFLTLLAVALLCLTGCACQHEWTEADCLTARTCTQCAITEGDALGHDFSPADCENPETCTRCGTTQGEALGHNWTEASCAAPETCGSCGKTQGEALPHALNKWEIDGEQMHRDCESCGFVETVAADREAYFWNHIVGHWDPYQLNTQGNTFWATILGNTSVFSCLQVLPDHSARLEIADKVYEESCTFEKFQSGDEGDYYYFSVDMGADGKAVFTFFRSEDGDSVLLVVNGGYLIYSQQETLQDSITGLWAAAEGEKVHKLELRSDGTFDFNGEMEGLWHIRPATQDNSSNNRTCDILLSYVLDGEQITHHMNVFLSEYSQDEIPAYRNDTYAYLYLENSSLHLRKLSPEELVELEAAQAEGKEKIIGTWHCVSEKTYDRSGGENILQINQTYSVEFREDGTFTAYLDTQKEGTWSFQSVDSGGDTLYFDYEMHYEDQTERSLDGDIRNSMLDIHEIYDDYSLIYTFRKEGDPADEEAIAYLTGTWSSVQSMHAAQAEATQDYSCSLTFREDGTVTGDMNGEKTGIWVHYETTTTIGYPNYSYLIQFDGETEAWDAYNGVSLDIYRDNEDGHVEYRFVKCTAEEREEYSQKLIGTWTSVAQREWISEKEYNEIPKTDYTITVREDGSFSASMATERTGTWQLRELGQERGIEYLFWFEDGSGYVFVIEANGRLRAWEETAAGMLMLLFEKK